MGGEIARVRLADVSEMWSGGTPSKDRADYWGGNLPWVSAKDMKERRLRDAEDHITQSGLASASRVAPVNATLVLVRGMTLLNDVPICSLARAMAFNQDVKAIVPTKEIEPDYLTYALLAAKAELLSMVELAGHGTGRLPTDRLKALQIPLPSKREQRAAANTLRALDDKIELNRRMNETLEAIARAIFKSWFVDFDPVRAKVARRWHRGEPLPGLPTDLYDLFPDSFENSPLGKIPCGWNVEPIGEHITAVKGLSYKGDGLADAGVPLYNLNSIYEGGGFKYEGIKYYVGDYKDRHLCMPGDVIVANTEQGFHYLLIGYPAIIPKHFGDLGIFTHHIYRVRPNADTPLTNNFIYLLLLAPTFRDQVVSYTNGTTVNALSGEGLEHPLLARPPGSLIKRFEAIVAPIFDQQEVLHEESSSLQYLRDALLPKLISGEIRVIEAERALSAAK